MIQILLFQICYAKVFVGFDNETLIIQSDLVNISNTNIQNFLNNEYIAMEFYFKENVIQRKVRQYYENSFSYYNIWIVENKRNNYKIYKITPFLNYKIELVYEFTNQELLCLEIYVFQDKFILDCTSFIIFQIFFIEFDFNTNQSHQLNFTFNYDLKSQRKLFFSNNSIIFLIYEKDNNIISLYNQNIFQEYQSLNKSHFQLPSLNVKKIITFNNYVIALTQCKRLYKYNLEDNQKPIQLCENLLIQDMHDISGVEILIFTKYHRYRLLNLILCYEASSTFEQPTMFQIIESEETAFETDKFNFKTSSATLLYYCNPYSPGKFYYYFQMLLCRQTHSLQLIILSTIQFQQILISNSFYKSGDDLVIFRSMEPGEITYIEQGLEFFPIIDVQSETVVVLHNQLFFGPNITYTIKAQDVEVEINKLLLINIYDYKCIHQELIKFQDYRTPFSFICQFENRSVIIIQNQAFNIWENLELNENFQFIYNLDIQLDKNYKIFVANSSYLQIINLNTKQISNYKQLNENIKQPISFKLIENYECQLLSQTVYCRKGFIQENSFTFQLIHIKKLGINEDVELIYLALNCQFLFLVTENYIIIIHIFMVDDQVLQFQIILIIQTKGEVKQLYFSQNILYIIYSNQGYLNISKYFAVSHQYFKYLGDVDCLGYKIGNLEENNNGAYDYYFINSEYDVIIFQLSRSLQDSFLKVIPNAKFLISSHEQFCVEQDNVKCYTILENQSILKINLDKFKISQNLPFEICAQNSKTIKCIRQQLKLLISWQKLIIQGYYIRQISINQFQIHFQIQQGYIKDLAIIDGNAILLKNIHKVQLYNISVISFQEIQDSIIINSYDQMMAFGKREQKFSIIGNYSCLRFIWINNHLICYEQQIFSFYNCDETWNCTFKNQAKLDGQIILLRSSGNFVLLKTNIQLMILQYRPKAYDFSTVFIEGEFSQFQLIQYINDNDFWLISVKLRQLKIYKFTNLQLQIQKTINYYERFYMDNQYQDKNDIINSIFTLRYDQNSITLLFMMQLSSHKAYYISVFNNEISISCQFILLWTRLDLQYQTLMISLNDNLLFVLMNENRVAVYDVSQNQNFYRNIIFSFKLNQVQQDLVVKKIYHFSDNDQVYMFVQTVNQLYVLQVDFNYTISLLCSKHTIVNLNRMKENILIKIDIPNQSDSNNYYQAIMVMLLFIYICIRFQLIKMIQ